MFNLLFYSINVDVAEARRVILIPVETTISENAHSEKHPFLRKKITLGSKLGPFFSGPSVSKILGSQGPQVTILKLFYTIPQMYGPHIFVFQKYFENIQLC